jgi:hypothetical protein
MNDFDDHIRKRKYPWIGRKWKRAVSSYVNHFLNHFLDNDGLALCGRRIKYFTIADYKVPGERKCKTCESKDSSYNWSK